MKLSLSEKMRQQIILIPSSFAVMWGQMIQHQQVEGVYKYPQLLRNHFSNLLDVILFASLFNNMQMDISRGLGFKVKSRPKTFAAIGLTAGFLYEVYQSKSTGNIDWADTGCYAVSTLAYLFCDAALSKHAAPSTEVAAVTSSQPISNNTPA